MSDAINILMPMEQEGSKSVVRAWLKQVGEVVKRDEPIVELETDKVAVEVPAPADGVLASIMLDEGAEAAPGAVLGVMSSSLATSPSSPAPGEAEPGPQASTLRPIPGSTGGGAISAVPEQCYEQRYEHGHEERREQRLSPLVRRLLAEHRLDAGAIVGTGREGRLTHADVEAYLKAPPRARAALGANPPVVRSHRVRHDSMRRFIAEHMTRSVQTAPHVTSIFEADFGAIAAHRARHKATSATPLTFSAYFVNAAAAAMQAAPNVNSRWHDDELEVFDSVNIGVGVALGDKGLIVPVIREAQSLTLVETAARLHDATERARAGKLAPADTQGGTFTISNHGVSGSLLAAPIIINQPQSAILGVGKLEKRVVVRETDGADAILIRPMAYVTLTIDHRVIDAHQTNAWLTRFVEVLETWPLEN
jgi:2-oxoglutarate dehydrogenase E2 component (dihydrolipoamide succinyltransferase)